MTKYLESERFIVQSNTKEALQKYADNYDRIFGKADETPDSRCERCDCDGATIRNCPYQGDVNNDTEQRCRCCDSCAHECAMDV